MSEIQWTDETLNVTVGCTRVSPGCENCYAEKWVHRGLAKQHRGLTRPSGKWNGLINLAEHRFADLFKWKEPKRVFVNSLSDLFHEGIEDEFIAKAFAYFALVERHTIQILTKRPERMRTLLSNREWLEGVLAYCEDYATNVEKLSPGELMGFDAWAQSRLEAGYFENIHLGVSVENQETADDRTSALLDTPAALRFLSCEPLLEHVALELYPGPHEIDWVIVGGESGPGARPCNVEWIRSIVKQCQAVKVPVFVKQLGSTPIERGEGWIFDQGKGSIEDSDHRPISLDARKGDDPSEWPEDLRVREFPS